MITGAHVMIYSTDADADRAMLRDVLGLDHVDVGHGWLIFKLPPAEAAVHPSDGNDRHELYLMCDDLDRAIRDLGERGVACDPVTTQRWGQSTGIHLPGSGKLGLSEALHKRP